MTEEKRDNALIRYLKSFVLAFQFLTRLPLPFELHADEAAFARALCFYPFVGAFIGAFCAAVCYLFGLLELYPLAGFAAVLCGYLLNGAFHLDGAADTCDAFFARKDPETTKRILKDTHMGVYGVLAVVSCVLIKLGLYSAISSVSGVGLFHAIALAPVAAKAGVALCSVCGGYAREEGTAKVIFEHMRLPYAAVCMLLSCAACVAVFGLAGLIAAGGVLLSGGLLAFWSGKRIGGITGDVLGAASEAGEIVFLLALFLARALT